MPAKPGSGPQVTWRTHVLIGIDALWLLAAVPGIVTPQDLGLLCAVAAFGALLPDLDAGDAKVAHLSVGGIRLLGPISRAMRRTLGHRGPMHSPFALVPLGAACLALGILWDGPAAAALWLGYASHLAADACTRTGIPLGRSDRRLFLLPEPIRFVTGSLAEERLLPFLASIALVLLLPALLRGP